MEESLNQRILELISLIEEKKEPAKTNQKKELDMKGLGKPISLGQAQNIKEYSTDFSGNVVFAFKSIGKKKIGLNEDNYSNLSQICEEVLLLNDEFRNFTTLKFIEEKIFDWLCDFYTNNEHPLSPLEYLQQELHRDLNTYSFYYVVNFIGIEHNFKLGKASIFHVDKNFIQEESVESALKDDEFFKMMESFQDKIVLNLSFKGIIDKAEELAKAESKLVINALRVFLIEDSITRHITLPVLDYVHKADPMSSYLCKYEQNDFYQWNMGMTRVEEGSGVPTQLDAKMFDLLNKNGLPTVSSFLLTYDSSELSIIIRRLINKSGNISFTSDFHERVVKIISVLEGVFLSSKSEKTKGLSTLKQNFVPKIFKGERKEQVLISLNKHYDIRNKYLHNDIRLKINQVQYYYFQKLTNVLIIKLLELYIVKKIRTEEDMLKYFDINLE